MKIKHNQSINQTNRKLCCKITIKKHSPIHTHTNIHKNTHTNINQMKPSKIQSDVDNYQTQHKYKSKYLYNTNVMNAKKKTNKPKNLNECV